MQKGAHWGRWLIAVLLFAGGLTAFLAPTAGAQSVLPTPITTTSGTGLDRITLDTTRGYAYASSGYFGNKVTIINTSTNTEEKTFAITGAMEVGVDPGTHFAYVPTTGNKIYVIDTSTNLQVDTDGNAGNGVTPITTPSIMPYGIGVDPTTHRAYIAGFLGKVLVIDTTNHTIVGSPITVPSGATTATVDITTHKVYVTSETPGYISIIDPANNNSVTSVSLPAGVKSVAVDPTLNRAYVTSISNNVVSILDTTTNTVVGTLTLPSPWRVGIDAAVHRAYITNNQNQVTVVNTTTATIVETFTMPAGSNLLGVAINPTTHYVYVAEYSGKVFMLDAPTVQTFGDVAQDYWAYSAIEQLFARGISTGCSTNPTNYCPEQPFTRAEMAVFLSRATGHMTGTTPTGRFADVSTNHWAAPYIQQIVDLGITNGCGDGTNFCPNDPVTREQMAVFLLRAKGWSPATPASPSFVDVSSSHWAYGAIEQLKAQNVTQGLYSDAQGLHYAPGSSVTRAQMAMFIIRAWP